MKVMHIHPYLLTIFMVFCILPCSGEEKSAEERSRGFMVKQQIEGRGINDPRVLKAMRKVPRHLFVPDNQKAFAYRDYPLPIGEGQTISQPYIVAYMTEALELCPKDKVLEIGTGSGYQAAVLAEIVDRVYSVEILSGLAGKARKILDKLGYGNVHIRIGDGYLGWPEEAPFDAIIVTCAPEQIPGALADQLKENGRMIIPVGMEGSVQELIKVVKKQGRLDASEVMPVRFVPMVKGNP